MVKNFRPLVKNVSEIQHLYLRVWATDGGDVAAGKASAMAKHKLTATGAEWETLLTGPNPRFNFYLDWLRLTLFVWPIVKTHKT